MTLRRSHLLIVAAAVVALVTACSSGESSSASAPSTSSSPSTSAPTPATPAMGARATVASLPAPTAGRHLEAFNVNGVNRIAIVVVPKVLSKATPLVFVFHGHGGTGANIERKFDIEGLWPQAIVVYPYGLVGHKGKTDPKGLKTGWQTSLGESGNRDLKFYDVMLASLRSTMPVDVNRIYAMGHSNGSAFVSLLLNQRGGRIAATANLSGQPSARELATDPTRSTFMSMGINDPIVPYANQKQAIPRAERKLGVDPAKTTSLGDLRLEKGRGNLELDTFIYPGGHEPPAIVPRLIVAFFRRHTLATG